MNVGKLIFATDGTKCEVFQFNENGKHEVLVKDGSLRDATEAIEKKVLEMQYKNGVGNFNPDRTMSAMVTNPDLRAKMQKIVDDNTKT